MGINIDIQTSIKFKVMVLQCIFSWSRIISYQTELNYTFGYERSTLWYLDDQQLSDRSKVDCWIIE